MKIATVCSGIGSPEQALKELEVEHSITFACEIDKYARQTYLANFKPELMLTDMTKEYWVGEQFYSDLFIGGIPCQAFSLAGKRMGELDHRGLLFYDFYRYVKNQQPKVFIIENVKGLLSDNNGKTFQNWCQLLGQSMNTHYNMFNHEDSLMYNLHFTVLNSKDYGVPQNRERVFLIGIRNDLPNSFRFPKGERLKIRLKDILEPIVDEKYYLSDKIVAGFNEKVFINQDTQASQVHDTFSCSPTISAGTHGYALGYIQEPICIAMRGRNPENPNSIKIGDKMEQTLEPNSQGITNTITSVQKDNLILVKEATNKGYAEASEGDSINLSNPNSETRRGSVGKQVANTLDTACNQAVVVQLNDSKESGGKQPYMQNRIYDSENISPALTQFSDRLNTTHSYRIRRLTPLECMRLQGYPDSYIKPCSDTQTYKQAGNSITVNVMKAIIKNLLPILKNN
jgi:DNA (cytosine-5)-methyltransferase 1